MNVKNLLDRVIQQTQAVIGTEFVAPARARVVHLRVAGITATWKTIPPFPPADVTFAVWRIASEAQAVYAAPASRWQIAEYLTFSPTLNILALAIPTDGSYPAMTAWQTGTGGITVNGPFPVHLINEAVIRPLDTYKAHFDGHRFWHGRQVGSSIRGDIMREALENRVKPEALKSITPEQRKAYAICLKAILDEEASRPERQLRNALTHAGASLVSYQPMGGSYRVEYQVSDRRFVSMVRPGDLTIETAGICLSRQDSKFDLQSLVGVMREHMERS